MSELAFATATQLSRMLRARKLSSLELTRLCLDRLRTIAPRYNALAELTESLALRQARAADRRLRAGARGLVGVPYGVKDVFATRGIPTRWGALPDQVIDEDAAAIEQLAGSVLVAKLAMVSLAGGGGYGSPAASIHGACKNPWNPARWTGSSSSGSAAAVAAGLVPFSLATDTFGSIVNPAAYCGVTGFRPSFGLVDRRGVMELAWSMDTVGVIARSAEDCRAVFGALAPLATAKPRRLRVGVLPLDYSGPGGREAAHACTDALRALGHRAVRVEWPNVAVDIRDLLGGECAAAHEGLIRSGRLTIDAVQSRRLASYLDITAAAYARAARQRDVARRAWLALFDDHDLLVTSTRATEAPALDADLTTPEPGPRGAAAIGPLAGLPVLSVPMGFGPNQLPLGLALIGRPLDDTTVLAAGIAFQRATDWHQRRPP